MPQEHEDVFAFGCDAFGQFCVDDFHSAAHFLVCDVEAFEGFYEDVAEIAVEGFFQAYDFLCVFLGEGAGEVFADESASVPYYVIHDGVGDVAQQVEYAQRQSGQKSHDAMFLLCPVFVHCQVCFCVVFTEGKVTKN